MRVSTTTLESFRLFNLPDQEWMSEESLIATIEGRFVPTPAVELGLAFGHVLECPDLYRAPGGYRHGAYIFDDDLMAPCLALMDRRGVYEAKAVKRYGDVDVVCKADQIVGAHIKEHKTTLSGFDVDKYTSSLQWRFMADIFGAVAVTYHVFLLTDHGNGGCELRGIETFTLYPYPDLSRDCRAWVERFTAYVEARGLAEGLRERQKAAA